MYILWSFWLLLALSIQDASAASCGSNESFAVSSQQDIDTNLNGCTEIYQIFITSNYTGAFVLPNTTTSVGVISLGANPSITSIVADGVTNMSHIYMCCAPALEHLSFKSLSAADIISIIQVGITVLDFPSLVNVSGDLSISGNMSSMNFPLLTGPLESLTVINQELEKPLQDLEYPPAPPLNISFPALESAFAVDLEGNISSIYMPNFETLYLYSPNNAAESPQFTISTNGNPLDISFPKLSNITSLSLQGSIRSVSFPSLLEVPVYYEIDAGIPLNVSLAPLESVGGLQLTGSISGVDLSTLQNISSLWIESNQNLNCTAANVAWDHTAHPPSAANYIFSDYSCTGPLPKPTPPARSTETLKFGLGFGIPALFLVIVFGSWLIYCFRRKRGVEKPIIDKDLPGYELGNLPKYTPLYGDVQNESHVESERSVMTPAAHLENEQSAVTPAREDEASIGENEEGVIPTELNNV